MTGKRGPVTGAKYGQPTGRPRQTLPANRATKPVAIFQSVNTDPPPVPDALGAIGSVIWRDVWAALPILSPRLDHSSVLRYCEAAEDAARARAEVDERGLLIDEPMADPRGGILGYKAVLNPAEMALRRADKVLLELGDRLGLSPASRARLGLVINQAALARRRPGGCLTRCITADVIDIETKRP